MAEKLSTTQTSNGSYTNNNKENKNGPKMLEEELLYSRKKHWTATQLKMSHVSKRRWLRQGSKYWLVHSGRHRAIPALSLSQWDDATTKAAASQRSPSGICDTNWLQSGTEPTVLLLAEMRSSHTATGCSPSLCRGHGHRQLVGVSSTQHH